MISPSFVLPPSDLVLMNDEIHVWCASLDEPGFLVSKLVSTLSKDERARAGRFYFEKDRRRYIVKHGILRMILGHYLGVEAVELRFFYERHGKPRFADTSGKGTFHFNLSHSEELALYAFCRDHEVGIDIERIRDFPDMERIVEQFFSVRERVAFVALPKSKKREAFFNCWTRKEAFIKAIGEGLYQPLDAFDVSLVPGEPARLLRIEGNSEMASRWFIQDLKPAPGFVGALALRTPVPVCYYRGPEENNCLQHK